MYSMMFFALLFSFLVEALPQRGGGTGNGGVAMGGGSSLIRFGCSQVVIDRVDPLVNPGMIPSPHVHQVIGGNAFNATMPNADISKLATCTTCTFTDDFSNYWTANIYFKARNGSFKRVPQVANKLVAGEQGGLTVYYTSPGPKQVTAFQPGFRMFYGDAMSREKRGSGWKSQSCFRCFTGKNFQGDNAAPCADPRLDTETFPAGPCPGGIRSNILFPTCWDGKNLDSPTHKDHVGYPVAGPAGFDPSRFTCPETHPVKIPQLMLEIVWDTSEFNDKSTWPADGGQPFHLSTGDRTGYGQHADYVFGWKGDALQKAMDGKCFGHACAGLPLQDFATANKCAVKQLVNENVEGWLDALPGDGSGA